MNRDVQRIMETDEYRRLFPGTQLGSQFVRAMSGPQPLRNSDVFEIIGRKGYYKCAGVGGAIVGKGFDIGIIDDPVKGHEAADSPTQRGNVWKWYTGDFFTRRGKDARILVIMTRWNDEDLAGMLEAAQRDDPKADKWEVVKLPAIKESTDVYPDDPRKPGEALWPARYPVEDLEKFKAAAERDWYSQYQQKPRQEGGVEWPESYFDGPGFWFEDWPPQSELEVRVIALDPSKGTDAKTGDYQARVKYGRDRNGVEYVEADLSHRPMTAPRSADGQQLGEGMVESCVEEISTFQPHRFALETNQFQVLLRIPFDQELTRRRIECTIAELNNTENKVMRIRRLGPPLSKGRIRFKANSRGTRLLVEQLKQFPLAAHDDGPDALEMARRVGVELFNTGRNG